MYQLIRYLVTVVSLINLAVGTTAAFAGEDSPRPNIVIILVDDMGYGDAGCYNSQSKIKTTHIDALAAAGMRFTDAHAPGPLCHMSRYGLMTGKYPFRINVNLWPKEPLITTGQTTIATVAKAKGYHTAMVGKWHVGFKETGYENPLPGGPVDCGFDSFYGMRASTDIPPYFFIRGDRAEQPPSNLIEASNSEGWSPIQGRFIRAGGIAPNFIMDECLPGFTNEAISVIKTHADNNKEKPLMLYLAYPGPHTPWMPTSEFVGKSGADMFGDFMMMIDAEIGRVLAALKASGMEDNTMVIFTSDNGPVWFESDVKRLGHASAGNLRGMKADAWEGGHRMPFIVKWPAHVAPGSIGHQTICFTDLLATFADLLKVPLSDDAGPDSFSFLPVLTGKQPAGKSIRAPMVMQPGSNSDMMMIRSGDWKLITGLGSGGFTKPNKITPGAHDPAGQLFNLATDLGETNNVYVQHPDIVARLTKELNEIVSAGRSR